MLKQNKKKLTENKISSAHFVLESYHPLPMLKIGLDFFLQFSLD